MSCTTSDHGVPPSMKPVDPEKPPALPPPFVEGGLHGYLTVLFQVRLWYSQNQLVDYTASDISWIGSVQLWVFFISGGFIGRLFDAYGPTLLLAAGTVIFTFSLMMTSLATKYYELILAQGFVFGIGFGLLASIIFIRVDAWTLLANSEWLFALKHLMRLHCLGHASLALDSAQDIVWSVLVGVCGRKASSINILVRASSNSKYSVRQIEGVIKEDIDGVLIRIEVPTFGWMTFRDQANPKEKNMQRLIQSTRIQCRIKTSIVRSVDKRKLIEGQRSGWQRVSNAMLEKVENNRNLKVLPEQKIRGGFQEKHGVVLQESLEKWRSISISIGKDHHW
ncbi:hypothetical protein P692DRAFT_201811719 [Suillus brevipes Sb2]|nr:hypothetical protein P692DRAFT_201811719 [Suillus brevipes Sb2]